jgi:thiaminase/transcriptional activator TenA
VAGLFDRLKADAAEDWWAYIAHDFVRAMGEGILAREAFVHYLVQDYLFLIQFARAYALAAYKADGLEDMRHASEAMNAILGETRLHVRLCQRWGIDEAKLTSATEARATVAYTRLVLDAGMRGDLLDLQVALAPCVIGYAEIGATLAQTSVGLAPDNPYREWIAEYAGEAYQALAEGARAELDRLAAVYLTEARYPRLLALFRQATRMEADFWQMGLTPEQVPI